MTSTFRSALPLTWLAAGLPLLAVSLTVLAVGPASSPLQAQEKKATVHYINGPREDAAIPRPGMNLIKGQVAVVITDPQNDFLSPKGVAWGVVGQSVTENNTVANIESLFKAVIAADATAAAKLPGYDGYEAAFVNYRMIASDVWSTAETVKKLGDLK